MTFVLMVLFLVVETVLPFEGLGLGLVKVVCLTTTFLVGCSKTTVSIIGLSTTNSVGCSITVISSMVSTEDVFTFLVYILKVLPPKCFVNVSAPVKTTATYR